MVAAEKGHEGTANALIKGGAKINAQNRDGNTALILAAQKGRRSVIKLLVANNADTSITNKVGKTALMLAQENKHGDTVKELSRARSGQSVWDGDSRLFELSINILDASPANP